MSSEAVPELELLTIEEEKELYNEVGEEVHMLDADELLAEDPVVQEDQDPPTLDTTIEPLPTDTTMEVDFDFGEIVGDLSMRRLMVTNHLSSWDLKLKWLKMVY